MMIAAQPNIQIMVMMSAFMVILLSMKRAQQDVTPIAPQRLS